jgi:hypothetical protein
MVATHNDIGPGSAGFDCLGLWRRVELKLSNDQDSTDRHSQRPLYAGHCGKAAAHLFFYPCPLSLYEDKACAPFPGQEGGMGIGGLDVGKWAISRTFKPPFILSSGLTGALVPTDINTASSTRGAGAGLGAGATVGGTKGVEVANGAAVEAAGSGEREEVGEVAGAGRATPFYVYLDSFDGSNPVRIPIISYICADLAARAASAGLAGMNFVAPTPAHKISKWDPPTPAPSPHPTGTGTGGSGGSRGGLSDATGVPTASYVQWERSENITTTTAPTPHLHQWRRPPSAAPTHPAANPAPTSRMRQQQRRRQQLRKPSAAVQRVAMYSAGAAGVFVLMIIVGVRNAPTNQGGDSAIGPYDPSTQPLQANKSGGNASASYTGDAVDTSTERLASSVPARAKQAPPAPSPSRWAQVQLNSNECA